MKRPRFIEIDGKRYIWSELLECRRAQLRSAGQSLQPTLFELKTDSRPPTQCTAAGRYREPLFAGLLDAKP